MYQSIITKYRGPAARGSRILASASGGFRKSFPYDHALSGDGNHRAAAQALAASLDWNGRFWAGPLDATGGPRVWVLEDTRDPDSSFTVADQLEPRAPAGPPWRGAHVQTYARLYLAVLNQDAHSRTCGYWYTVTDYATPHTAFATRAALLRWLEERGLAVDADIPEPGEFAGFHIRGAYRTALHMDRPTFDGLRGEHTRVMDNAEYTLGIVTHDTDGLRTVHKLNVNVRDRPVFDYAESRATFG